ncbi:hypothetical protein [Candidatus Nitrososphaera sp. FF02]|uniref:nucleotide-binding protein n=1 Tax=Candidatus Nitrososphaera sp. FF02 TaxID=3398226 RepID=UPI0039E9B359
MARRAKLLMVQGTSSGAGKSVTVAGLCRMYADRGYRVAPFKSQNMSSKLYVAKGGGKMAQAQAIQAAASRKEPDPRMNPILLRPLGDYRSEVIVNGRFHSEMHARDYYEKFALRAGPAARAKGARRAAPGKRPDSHRRGRLAGRNQHRQVRHCQHAACRKGKSPGGNRRGH